MYRRRIVELAPSAFLVVDESDTDASQITRFHLPLADFEVNERIVSTDYPATSCGPAVRLHIASLSGNAASMGETDVPDKDGLGKFSTQEINFPCQKANAFLICAQNVDAPFSAEADQLKGDGWQIGFEFPTRENGWHWQLRNELSEAVLSWPSLSRF